ncbi:signal peptidase I [Agromyces sp. Marseille-Q5079]|uniref:signal peptidase I n=1 Tax=Agromyces sp. Marseille-Q5079 TaxID=3439059 RepID=UPI003D9C9ACE
MRRRTFVPLASAVLAVGLAAGAAVVASGAAAYRADSDSMSPTIDVGDLVVAAGQRGGDLHRGDVVVFADPGGWGDRVARLLGRGEASTTFVKRVVGLPGERIACCTAGGELTVDGVPLEEDYRVPHEGLASVLAFDETVPDDAVFVLGDARAASIDSRYLGSVPVGSVLGTVRFVVPFGG